MSFDHDQVRAYGPRRVGFLLLTRTAPHPHAGRVRPAGIIVTIAASVGTVRGPGMEAAVVDHALLATTLALGMPMIARGPSHLALAFSDQAIVGTFLPTHPRATEAPSSDGPPPSRAPLRVARDAPLAGICSLLRSGRRPWHKPAGCELVGPAWSVS
jgi:hypothetical protein